MSEQEQAQEQRAPLYVTQSMLGIIEKGLMQLPYGEVAPVINDINNQLQQLQQMAEAAEAAKHTDVAEPAEAAEPAEHTDVAEPAEPADE